MRTLFLVISLVIACFARGPTEKDDGEGCCFYKEPRFKGVIACTSDDYDITDGAEVRSFYCTKRFSAALLDKGKPNEPLELVGCGDTVNATTKPIPANKIAVGPCAPQRRCCFYTGKNKDGDEFCLNSVAATAQELTSVQQNGKLRVAECTADYRASMVAKNGKKFDVGCGVTLDVPEGAEFSAISMTPCRNSAESEAVEFTFDSEFDQATSEDDADNIAADLSEFNVDQAFNGDEGESFDQFTEQFDGDQALGDAAIGETGEREEFNPALGDISPESDAAIGDVASQFDNPFAAHASAIGDTSESDFNSDFNSDFEFPDQAIDDAEFGDQANIEIEFVVDPQFSEVFDSEDDSAVAGDQQNLEQSSSASSIFVSLAVIATLAMLF